MSIRVDSSKLAGRTAAQSVVAVLTRSRRDKRYGWAFQPLVVSAASSRGRFFIGPVPEDLQPSTRRSSLFGVASASSFDQVKVGRA
jgi:hypothetical protein